MSWKFWQKKPRPTYQVESVQPAYSKDRLDGWYVTYAGEVEGHNERYSIYLYARHPGTGGHMGAPSVGDKVQRGEASHMSYNLLGHLYIHIGNLWYHWLIFPSMIEQAQEQP